MNKNTLDKFSDYTQNLKIKRNFFIVNIEFFHPKPILIFVIWSLLLLSIFNLHYLKFCIPLICVYFYLKAIMNKHKRTSRIKRNYPLKGKEHELISIKHQISNPSSFNLYNFLFIEFFEGHINTEGITRHIRYYPKIFRHQNFKYEREVLLNNGMGNKRIGPTQIQFTDPIGIHLLTNNKPGTKNMEIYPKVFPTQVPKSFASIENLNFGGHDTQNRGDNVNFFCAREYRHGDNIKHINWKLTLKSNKTIINQFENNTNSQINLLLIDDTRLHFGAGALSSFEYCKDLILSFCHSHIKSNNSIGLISHQITIKSTPGQNHLTALELAMTRLTVKEFNNNNLYKRNRTILPEINHLLKQVLFQMKDSLEIFIFTGFIPGQVWNMYFEIFKKISQRNYKVHLVVPNGFRNISNNATDLDKDWIQKLQLDLPKHLIELKENCKKSGIALSLVNIDSQQDYITKIWDGFEIERN